jgi:hypothetical protein
MTQALNYTPDAIACMRAHAERLPPLSCLAWRWIADKLERAQVFLLPDKGNLLDRSKPAPALPGEVFRPPFPIVACEFAVPGGGREVAAYKTGASSKRIALAFEWQNDLPAPIASLLGNPVLSPGVMIVSLSFIDAAGIWMSSTTAVHQPYDIKWLNAEDDPEAKVLIDSGVVTKARARTSIGGCSGMPILPELYGRAVEQLGYKQALATMNFDMMDEIGAYRDLCQVLACANVEAKRHPAPTRLNEQRLKKGKLPLMGFHLLTLNDGDGTGAGGIGDRRAHVRRGHIRRLRHLAPDRITWVNATMVRGSAPGFVDKQYDTRRWPSAAGARAAKVG